MHSFQQTSSTLPLAQKCWQGILLHCLPSKQVGALAVATGFREELFCCFKTKATEV